jgi:hypothetical protein
MNLLEVHKEVIEHALFFRLGQADSPLVRRHIRPYARGGLSKDRCNGYRGEPPGWR